MSETPTEHAEKEPTPKELIKLEIGSGGTAGYDPAQLKQGSVIYTVDEYYRTFLNNSGYEEGLDKYPGRFTHIKYDDADARELPFDDDSIGEVLLCNVMSYNGVSPEAAAQILSEAVRVGDRVVLSDNNTPEETDAKFLGMDFETAGINVQRFTSRENYDEIHALNLGLASGQHGEIVHVLTKGPRYGEAPLEYHYNLPFLKKERERQAAKAEHRARRRQKLADSTLGHLIIRKRKND